MQWISGWMRWRRREDAFLYPKNNNLERERDPVTKGKEKARISLQSPAKAIRKWVLIRESRWTAIQTKYKAKDENDPMDDLSLVRRWVGLSAQVSLSESNPNKSKELHCNPVGCIIISTSSPQIRGRYRTDDRPRRERQQIKQNIMGRCLRFTWCCDSDESWDELTFHSISLFSHLVQKVEFRFGHQFFVVLWWWSLGHRHITPIYIWARRRLWRGGHSEREISQPAK